jgi:hypothetical protein
MYKWLRSLLFLFPPESVHHFSMFVLNGISATSPGRYLLRKAFSFNDPALKKYFSGLEFKNAAGLAAGFDKNALYLQSLETLGFGFVEMPDDEAGQALCVVLISGATDLVPGDDSPWVLTQGASQATRAA